MPRARRGDWERIVEACRRSGLTQREFAARHGLALGTLRSWVYVRRRADSARRLLPVRVAAAPQRAPIEIALPSGVVMRFGGEVEPEAIAALVRALA